MKRHAVIYIPGLGDARVQGQRAALKLWRLQGIEPYLIQMHWLQDEPLERKQARLYHLIERLIGEGKTVSLLAASAGASVALAAYVRYRTQLNGVALLSGKIHHPETVSPGTYRQNPAFRAAMDQLPGCLDKLANAERQRIISLAGRADLAVPAEDSRLDGARFQPIPAAGHMLSIAYGLTVASPLIIRFLRRLGAENR